MKRTPIRRKRRGTRRGQPTQVQKHTIKERIYERDGGRCQLNISPQCLRGVLPMDGELMFRAHLMHKRSRGAGGDWSDDNLAIGCSFCHEASHNSQGKPCPAKVRS